MPPFLLNLTHITPTNRYVFPLRLWYKGIEREIEEEKREREGEKKRGLDRERGTGIEFVIAIVYTDLHIHNFAFLLKE